MIFGRLFLLSACIFLSLRYRKDIAFIRAAVAEYVNEDNGSMKANR